MEGIEHFDWEKNMNRVKAGFKGSLWFQNGVKAPARTIVDGEPPEVAEKLGYTSIPTATPTDPWVVRYPNSKMR